ncbi:MAG: ATP synthase F1 subunit delta [Acidimicrobiia bacterium]|nr:ATP synthase F1 subunit delta [Acidimicrobiia bacterium]
MSQAEGYAAGIAEIASAEGELDKVSDELLRVARAVEGSAELRDALGDIRLPAERKATLIEELLDGKASPLTISLASFVITSGRARQFSSIAELLAAKAAAVKDRAVAEVRSAIELDEATLAKLTEALSRATGKQIEVKTVTDPSVLGGVVATVGDVVIDGSVKGRLRQLRTQLETTAR